MFKNLFRKTPKYQKTADNLKILAFADLHWLSNEEWIVLKNVKELHPDIILLLGDIGREEAITIAHAAEEIPVLYVFGNHDTWEQFDNIPNIINMDDRIWQYKNTTVAGISGSVRYKDGNEYCMRTQEEITGIAKQLLKADILISHDGPYHLMSTNHSHEGLKGITWYVKNKRPSLVIFGHQHEKYEGFIEKTKTFCVFRCAIIDTESGKMETLF